MKKEDMTEEQLNYIRSFNNWVKGQNIGIEMNQQNIDNSVKMIEIHSKSKDIAIISIEHDKRQLTDSINSFNEWCDLNELTNHKITL